MVMTTGFESKFNLYFLNQTRTTYTSRKLENIYVSSFKNREISDIIVRNQIYQYGFKDQTFWYLRFCFEEPKFGGCRFVLLFCCFLFYFEVCILSFLTCPE